MPIKPMSPSAAVEEFEEKLIYASPLSVQQDWLRTAFHGVLCWAAEECKPKDIMFPRSLGVDKDYTDGMNEGRYIASNKFHAALLKAAEEIGGV